MIRNDTEYKKAIQRLNEENDRLQATKDRLIEQGLKEEGVKRVMDPLESFHLQLREETESYEKLKRGEFDELINLRGVGHNQRELAEKLEVNESQVSRDERNEYHGITIDRANRILEALGVEIHSKVDFSPYGKVA